MCLTDHPGNRIPFPKPEGYDPRQYELLLRIFEAGWRETFQKFDAMPNRKTDTNNHGPFSTDNIGMNYDYPDASYARRREILQEHERYQKGWLCFIANDPRVPTRSATRCAGGAWRRTSSPTTAAGRTRSTCARRGGWWALRDDGARLPKTRPTPDPVGMGAYTMDSHNVQRYVTADGGVQNEGDIGVSTTARTRSLTGRSFRGAASADNLLVPVCVSSSHIAYGSIRMEPVFMVLGQSAATAAALAIDAGIAVQDLPYAQLRDRLLKDGQVLERR